MTRTSINNRNCFWFLMSIISCVLGGYGAGVVTGMEYYSILNPTFFSWLYFISLFLIGFCLVLFIEGVNKQLKEK